MARGGRKKKLIIQGSPAPDSRDPMQRFLTRRHPKYVTNQPGPGPSKTKHYRKR